MDTIHGYPGNQAPIVAKGSIEVAIAAMRGHPDDIEIQRDGCGLFSDLASDPGSQAPIIARGGIEVVIAMDQKQLNALEWAEAKALDRL